MVTSSYQVLHFTDGIHAVTEDGYGVWYEDLENKTHAYIGYTITSAIALLHFLLGLDREGMPLTMMTRATCKKLIKHLERNEPR